MTTVNASPDTPPQGKRERRKIATRAELIAAGTRLFGANGLYEARIEDLTTSAGIAKGTLYSYFADKDELIRSVVSTGFAELEQHVARRVQGGRAEEPLLRGVIRAHLTFFAEHPDLMRVFHQIRGMLKFDRPAWRPLRASLTAYLERLASILSATPRVERMSTAERLELAGLLFGTVSGVTSVWAATGHYTSKSRSARTLVSGLALLGTHFVTTCASPGSTAASAGSSRRRRSKR